MTPRKAQLQRRALALRSLPGVDALYRAWYAAGCWALVAFVRLREGHAVKAAYLRRGVGRSELVPAASDLDFFLVLTALPAEQEMEFLKHFWSGYHRLRRVFPFLGEVLMGDENELANWLAIPSVRAFEASFSWKRLFGSHVMPASPPPSVRDLFSEALRNYADLLQVLLKIRPEQFRAGLRAHDLGAIHFRNGAKAALDLFRLHASFRGSLAWRYTRLELTEQLRGYGNLRALAPILQLKGTLFREDPFPLYAELARRGLACLDELARALAEESAGAERTYRVPSAASHPLEPHSFSVRELFAERILLRHRGLVRRAVLSESSSGMYFALGRVPNEAEMRELLADLRDVHFSFERFSLAMPLTEAAYLQLAETALLDSPFHASGTYRAIELRGDELVSRREQPAAVKITAQTLRKSFAELSFALRLQPNELPHFLDKMLGVVLGLRLAGEQGEVAATLPALLERYGDRFPERATQVRAHLSAFWPSPVEEEIWNELEAGLLARKGAENLRAQLQKIRAANRQLPLSGTLPSDLWINLTPFLRREMNAMKDYYFTERAELKL